MVCSFCARISRIRRRNAAFMNGVVAAWASSSVAFLTCAGVGACVANLSLAFSICASGSQAFINPLASSTKPLPLARSRNSASWSVENSRCKRARRSASVGDAREETVAEVGENLFRRESGRLRPFGHLRLGSVRVLHGLRDAGEAGAIGNLLAKLVLLRKLLTHHAHDVVGVRVVFGEDERL